MLRFAQNPEENMTIGNLRIALFNFIVSKQENEELSIRIDDVNKDKNSKENKKEKELLELLNLFGIEYARVVAQSENIKYHTGMAMKLLLDKKSFNCFCSDEALEQDKQKAKKEGKPYSYSGFCETISDETKFHCNAPFVVRLKKPSSDIKIDLPFQGEITFTPSQIDSFIILNHDKTPTADFASGVDDMLYDISTVIQEQEQFLNTARHLHVMHSLGYEKKINYIDLPSITNSDITVQPLIDEGYLPSAIANYLVLLGFNAPQEIFTIEEATQWFDIKELSKEAVTFDKEKLNSINKEYLKNLDEMRLSKILGYADTDIGKLAKLYLKECNTINEIKEKIDMIFSQKGNYEKFSKELDKLKECLQNAPYFEEIKELQEYISDQTNLQKEVVLKLLSFAITGSKEPQNLEDIYPYIKNYLGRSLNDRFTDRCFRNIAYKYYFAV